MKTMRNLKKANCIDCDKEGVFCKERCQACYSKMRRKTPEGKQQLKNYYLTKGKEAQKRYLAKQPKKENITKHPKICSCGKKSIAKGFCRSCYQNKRNKINKVYVQKEQKNYNEIFLKVLKNVKKGFTIQNSCKKEGMNSTGAFYRNISDIQKQELRSYKSINKIINKEY